MEQILAILVFTIMVSAFFVVVGALLPGMVGNSHQQIASSPGRAFLIGLASFVVLLALFAATIQLVRTTGLGILNLLPLIVVSIFAFTGTIGLISSSQFVGARLFSGQPKILQNILGALFVVLASLIPVVGIGVLFPYLLISGFGGVALSLNQWRKSR